MNLLTYHTQIYLFCVNVYPTYLTAAVGLFDRGLTLPDVELTNGAERFRVRLPSDLLGLNGRAYKLDLRMDLI